MRHGDEMHVATMVRLILELLDEAGSTGLPAENIVFDLGFDAREMGVNEPSSSSVSSVLHQLCQRRHVLGNGRNFVHQNHAN